MLIYFILKMLFQNFLWKLNNSLVISNSNKQLSHRTKKSLFLNNSNFFIAFVDHSVKLVNIINIKNWCVSFTVRETLVLLLLKLPIFTTVRGPFFKPWPLPFRYCPVSITLPSHDRPVTSPSLPVLKKRTPRDAVTKRSLRSKES